MKYERLTAEQKAVTSCENCPYSKDCDSVKCRRCVNLLLGFRKEIVDKLENGTLVEVPCRGEVAICESYRERETIAHYTDYELGLYAGKGINPPITKVIGFCIGTSECEQCHCEGDKTKCDFYGGEK